MATMIVTLSISAALLFVYVLLILPRPKYASLKKSFKYMKDCARAAAALEEAPTAKNVAALAKLLGKCSFYALRAKEEGLSEIASAVSAIDEAQSICKSLLTVKADEARISAFAGILIDKISFAHNKTVPLSHMFKGSDEFTFDYRAKAERTLNDFASAPRAEAEDETAE